MEKVLTKRETDAYLRGQNTQGVSITINGLTVREEADITKIANKLVQKINQNKMVYGSLIALSLVFIHISLIINKHPQIQLYFYLFVLLIY